MARNTPSGAVKQRRAELDLTQQEAARRADVSLATWRRFENAAGDAGPLDGFRADNVQGFARALKLGVAELRRLAGASPADEASAGGHEQQPLVVDRHTAQVVRLFNSSFTGGPLTPADAMALASTVAYSAFAHTPDGRVDLDSPFSYEFTAYLKGEATIRDVELLCDLPELALTQVNHHWLVRMGERIMRIGSELDHGRVPRPQCLADEYALWIVIKNTDPPQIDRDLIEAYPGLQGTTEIFGYDPDTDDPDIDDPDDQDHDDHSVLRAEWMDRMTGLLPSEEDHDYRMHDLVIMEGYGQGIYDPTDPRHPARWFDRDDLRERCESELAFARLPKHEQEARSIQALNRTSEILTHLPADKSQKPSP